MRLFSPISYGIRWILVSYGRREDLAQDLVPEVTPSQPSSSEGITNEVYVPHDEREQN